jgi:hypothetical protein
VRSKILAGTTSLSAPIFVTNSSAGGGLGSLVFGTSGLVGEYRRAGSSSWTSISLVTATLGTFASGGWIADGGLTGAYEVGIPNAALAAGEPWVAVRFYGASSMTPVLLYFELDAVNYQSTSLGLSLAKGTNITGFNDLAATAIVSGGAITTAGGAVSTVTAVGTLTTYAGNTVQTGDSFARLGAPSGASIDADILSRLATSGYTAPPTTAAIAAAIAAGSVGSVTGAVGSVTAGVSLVASGLDAVVTESGVNAAQALALILDMVAAKLSGLPAGPAVIRDINDTVNRITIGFDSNNNRTSSVINNLPAV